MEKIRYEELRKLVDIKELKEKAISLNICPECGNAIIKTKNPDQERGDDTVCSINKEHYYKKGCWYSHEDLE